MSGADTDIQWFIARDGKQHGPVSDLELKKIVELAHLKPTDLVWRQGFADWRAASSVFPGLAAPASSPAPQPQASSFSAPAAAKPAAASPAAAPKGPAPQQYAPYAPGASPQESWRPQTEAMHPDQIATRPLGSPTVRTAGPFPATGQGAGPAPGPSPTRLTTDSRKPSEMPPHQAAAPPSRRRKFALVATGLLAMTGVGAWLSSQYKDQIFGYVEPQSTSVETGTATANLVPPAEPPAAAAAAVQTAATAAPSAEEVDRKLQSRSMWVTVKQEFPDWYQSRVAEVARLSAEQTAQAEITRYLIGELVALRRENAKHALAASTTRHKELAAAFLANLNRLSQESGDGCYDFISKGESSATVVERLDDPAKSAEIEAQVVAIVGAIVEGRKQPAEHAAPVKTDYDVLAGELGRLGWTQADMQLFANPKALAQAPRARVCNMLKDWFTAHLAIQDPSTQERLLFETLKPVISG